MNQGKHENSTKRAQKNNKSNLGKERLAQDLEEEFTMNIHAMLDYKPLQES
jgi:hypothetical protein